MSSQFQKKFSSKSPFRQEIDPTELQYTTTNTAKTLSGKVVPTGGEAVVNIPSSREVEKTAPSNEQYIQSFQPEYKKAQEGGYTGTMPEYIKEKEAKLGYTDRNVTVTRERDYSRSEDLDLNILKGMADRRPTYFPKDAPVNTQDSLSLNTQYKIAKRLGIPDEAFAKEYNRRTGKEIRFGSGNGKLNTTEKLSNYIYDINDTRTGN